MDKETLKKDMEQFYSSSHNYLNQLKSHSIKGYQKYLDKILALVAKKSKILDIGCGTGQVANFLAEKDYEVIGIDLSSIFVKEAKKGKAKFKVMDSTSLKFKDNSFDAVISAETLEHIPNPEKALLEMTRVLKKDGLIFLRFPNKQSTLNNFSTLLLKKPLFQLKNPNLSQGVWGEDEDLCYLASTADVLVFLKNQGFKILYTKPFFWRAGFVIAKK